MELHNIDDPYYKYIRSKINNLLNKKDTNLKNTICINNSVINLLKNAQNGGGLGGTDGTGSTDGTDFTEPGNVQNLVNTFENRRTEDNTQKKTNSPPQLPPPPRLTHSNTSSTDGGIDSDAVDDLIKKVYANLGKLLEEVHRVNTDFHKYSEALSDLGTKKDDVAEFNEQLKIMDKLLGEFKNITP